MIKSHSVVIWLCVIAFLGIQIAESQMPEAKLREQRRIRALRPSFVKRETEAPLIPAGDEKIEDEYIVKLRDDLTDEELAEFEEKFQALSEEHGLHIDFQINVTRLMKGFVARIPGDAVHILRWLDEVEFVEEDEVVHGNVEWGLDRIDQADLPLDNVYQSSLGDGSGVNVFVLDTGIRFTHNEFGGRAHPFYDAFSDGQNGNDCHGHGTHCAGTVGGSTVGVAPGVTLYAGRVLDCRGSGSSSTVIGAMDAVAASNMKPAVVSMSLGGGHSSSTNLAVKRLTDAGYIVVVAAGNEGADACTKSPASAPEAITVGATESDDDFASYSNSGSCVNILAPGSNVRSAAYSGDASYTSMSGTSMATPHVAGVAALMLAGDSTLTQSSMLTALLNNAQSNKIDLSSVPSSRRGSTPNKLLHIPGGGGGGGGSSAFECSFLVGTDLRGASVGTVPDVQKAGDCCAHCQANSQCTVWTWSITGKSCYLRSSITEIGDISWAVAGIVSRQTNNAMKCSGYVGTDLQGPNLNVEADTASTDACCEACLANPQCTVWAYSLSGKSCYLRNGFDTVVKTWWAVSGIVSRV